MSDSLLIPDGFMEDAEELVCICEAHGHDIFQVFLSRSLNHHQQDINSVTEAGRNQGTLAVITR